MAARSERRSEPPPRRHAKRVNLPPSRRVQTLFYSRLRPRPLSPGPCEPAHRPWGVVGVPVVDDQPHFAALTAASCQPSPTSPWPDRLLRGGRDLAAETLRPDLVLMDVRCRPEAA